MMVATVMGVRHITAVDREVRAAAEDQRTGMLLVRGLMHNDGERERIVRILTASSDGPGHDEALRRYRELTREFGRVAGELKGLGRPQYGQEAVDRALAAAREKARLE